MIHHPVSALSAQKLLCQSYSYLSQQSVCFILCIPMTITSDYFLTFHIPIVYTADQEVYGSEMQKTVTCELRTWLNITLVFIQSSAGILCRSYLQVDILCRS